MTAVNKLVEARLRLGTAQAHLAWVREHHDEAHIPAAERYVKQKLEHLWRAQLDAMGELTRLTVAR